MNALATVVLLTLGPVLSLAQPQLLQQAQALEREGNSRAALALLRKAAMDAPHSGENALAYAEFLDRYADPETAAAYEKALALSNGSQRGAIVRRLLALSLIEGDSEAVARYAQAAGWKVPERADSLLEQSAILVPGPLSSFARMAAISPEQDPRTLLAVLGRNVTVNGYRASDTGESPEPTEYMKLLLRYVSQARELAAFAGDSNEIRIASCESPETGELLRILGYRMRGGCGSELVLETVNAGRAFITIDSGFPLAELEQALRTNRPFLHPYQASRVPVLYEPDFWISGKDKQKPFIESFLADPAACRLYTAMANMDEETANELRKSVPPERLRAFAHVLDFFGGMLEIRGGRAAVPGGARSEAAWEELAGAPPSKGAAFIDRLIARDDGWLAGYFDALARAPAPVSEYVSHPQRLRRFYTALRGRITSPGPARPVFRSNADLMMLLTRLRIGPDGTPHVPGGLQVWKDLFTRGEYRKSDVRLPRRASSWTAVDDLMEALFSLARKPTDNEPLRFFLAASDLDRGRANPLRPATIARLARDYHDFEAQFTLLNETPLLRDETIVAYLDAAGAINGMGNALERADAAGMMQALAGLWQVMVRHGEIDEPDAALNEVIAPFLKQPKGRELFDAGRAGVRTLLAAARSPATASPQDRMMELLSGTVSPRDAALHTLYVQEMMRKFEAQRLVSLDTLFDFADNLESVSRGEKLDARLAARLASRIAELQTPQSSLSAAERAGIAYGYWSERHIQQQARLNLRREIERAGNDAQKLANIRGDLAPVLRDTLVGLLYIHYSPPGAQLIHASQTFVRGHDFIGIPAMRHTWRKTGLPGVGWPASAGGRLSGSLAGLPYALAEAEQNFLIPTREQALIWADLVPQMMISAIVPRWWKATPAQIRWIALHLRYGEALVADAAFDAAKRDQLAVALREHTTPGRLARIVRAIAAGDVSGALRNITPAELFLAAKYSCESGQAGGSFLARRIIEMPKESPELTYAAIAALFGTPKPELTTSYRPGLLHLRPFPTLMGYSSRIMAESWESNTLYWAALAAQVHMSPEELNTMIPEWTRMTAEKIFATHLEDWPAVLRSVRAVGEQERLRLLIAAGGVHTAGEE